MITAKRARAIARNMRLNTLIDEGHDPEEIYGDMKDNYDISLNFIQSIAAKRKREKSH